LRDKLILILIPVVVNIVYLFVLLNDVTIPGSVPDLLLNQVIIGDQAFRVLPADDPSVQLDYQRVTVGNETYALQPVEPFSSTYPQIPQSELPVEVVPLAISSITIEPHEYDSEFWSPFFAGLFYNSVTTLNFALAIVGFTIFRSSILGVAWGLLLLGIALNAVGDIIYDFTTIYRYDRTNPAMDFWVFGSMIVSYALFIHRKQL
jgi:hypothetical protein